MKLSLRKMFRPRRLTEEAALPPQRRTEIARPYLRGTGLEIGALHAPMPVPPEARVTYVDRLSAEDLRRHYPELAGRAFAPVDVIDDGERLEKFEADSQDFVIANHFLEHAQDPIGALRAHLRVLKPGGVLVLAVPNRRCTFDRDRPPTTWEHLLRDHREGPAWSYEAHLREYAALVDRKTGPELEQRVEDLRRMNYSIHFHVWDDAEFHAFLDRCRRECGLPMEVEYFENLGPEMACIVRKSLRFA